MNIINGLSLFANVGMAETYLDELGVSIVLANELLEERAKFYRSVHPYTEMLCGDITDNDVRRQIIAKAKAKNVEFLMATPPCQGMSRHGKRDPLDPRNFLIYYALDVIKELKPKFVLLENVPKLLTTKISINGKLVLIPDYIKQELAEWYNFADETLFNSDEYGVPQSRTRCIYRMVRKDVGVEWTNPTKSPRITMEQAIGHLPSLDPLIREEKYRMYFPLYEEKKAKGLAVSKWHYPPTHGWKHVLWMSHTPSGKTAFYNEKYYPAKDDGTQINGRLSCYRRFAWERPANTITQNNGVISSSCCVHPGRFLGQDENGDVIYSDARVLTIYELLIVSSLPIDWNIPEWASEKLVRNVIGEGVPPLMVKEIVKPLIDNLKNI